MHAVRDDPVVIAGPAKDSAVSHVSRVILGTAESYRNLMLWSAVFSTDEPGIPDGKQFDREFWHRLLAARVPTLEGCSGHPESGQE